VFLDWKAQQEIKAEYTVWHRVQFALYCINELGLENIKRGLREITWDE